MAKVHDSAAGGTIATADGGEEPERFVAVRAANWGWARCAASAYESERGFWGDPCHYYGVSFCLWGAFYGAVGCGCREEERKSFRAVVTPTRLVVRERKYDCCDIFGPTDSGSLAWRPPMT